MKKLGICTLLLLLGGCAAAPTVLLPYVLDSSSVKAKIMLDADARVIVGQPVKVGQTCEKVKSALSATVMNVKRNEKVPLTLSCTEVKGAVSLVSPVLSKGPYVVEVKGGDVPLFTDTPSVVLRYPDPDFKSGADQEWSGAKELVANQSIKGLENYTEGITTQWIHLKGKKGRVALTFFEEGDGRWLNAQVYALNDDGNTLRFLGLLIAKHKREFQIEFDNLYVKVMAREFSGERKYSLLRHDSQGGKSVVSIGVIDCYPVGNSSAVVLLKATDAVKINEEIAIYGKKASGETVSLGKCTVTGISGGQASCRLQEARLSHTWANTLANILEYRAEVVGGQTS